MDKCLERLRKGDTLVVWRLDRLGRSMRHLIDLVEQLKERGVGFKSLCDGAIDTTTASGELIFNVFACLAQFERRLIQERTKAGLTAARARGRLGGRRPIPVDEPRIHRVDVNEAFAVQLQYHGRYDRRQRKIFAENEPQEPKRVLL